MPSKQGELPVSIALVERRIHRLRHHNVMLDRDLAELYQVKTIALRQQVKRNLSRFPPDFMFQLTAKEAGILVSQSVIPSLRSLGGSLPYVFTQEGVAMLSAVLSSPRAVQVNIAIMRAFVQLRRIAATHKEMAQKIQALEKKFGKQNRNIVEIFRTLKSLVEPDAREPETKPAIKPKNRIGYPIR
jgi:hypothetical protein